MNKSVSWLTLDLNRRDVQGSVSFGQGETGRRLCIRLVENGKPYEIGRGCFAVMSGTLPDGSTFFNECVISDNVIVYDVTAKNASQVGVAECEVQIYGYDGGLLRSPRLHMVIHKGIFNVEDVEDSQEFTALTAWLADAKEAIENAGQGGSKDEQEVVWVTVTEDVDPETQETTHTTSMLSSEIHDAHTANKLVVLKYGDAVYHLDRSDATSALFSNDKINTATDGVEFTEIIIILSSVFFYNSSISGDGGASGGGGAAHPTLTLNQEKKLTGGAGFYSVNVVYSSIPISFGTFYFDPDAPTYSETHRQQVGGEPYSLIVAADGSMKFTYTSTVVVDGALKMTPFDYTDSARFFTARLGDGYALTDEDKQAVADLVIEKLPSAEDLSV